MEVCLQKLLLHKLWITVKTKQKTCKAVNEERQGFTSVEFQTDLPRWLQSAAQVNNVLSPEFMQRQEQLVPTVMMINTVMLGRKTSG